jgi:hypothetical protein
MALRALCFALTWGRDAVFPFARARQLDHLHYRSLGHEIPLIDVMPLSVLSHRIVTNLRDSGMRGPTNLVLRLAGLTWLALDGGTVLSLGLLVTGHGGMLVHGFYSLASLPHEAQAQFRTITGLYR